MYRFYLIIIDRGGVFEGFNYKRFHEQLTTANGVNSWWHYLQSTYILKVDYNIDISHVSDYVRKIAPEKRFLATEMNPGSIGGWLPKEAWDWIKKHRGWV